MLERSSDKFDPTASVDNTYYDLDKEELLYKELLEKQNEKKLNELGEDLSQSNQVLVEREANMEKEIKNEKKAKAREHLKLLKQFDSLSDSVQLAKAKGEEAFKINKKETAGDIKRREREKSKKEKTLGAKLRLKAKKTK